MTLVLKRRSVAEKIDIDNHKSCCSQSSTNTIYFLSSQPLTKNSFQYYLSCHFLSLSFVCKSVFVQKSQPQQSFFFSQFKIYVLHIESSALMSMSSSLQLPLFYHPNKYLLDFVQTCCTLYSNFILNYSLISETYNCQF